MNYKVGDSILYNYAEYKVEDMEDGRVRSVTNGIISTSGSRMNNSIFPYSSDGASVSAIFKGEEERMLLESRGMNLNPDVFHKFEQIWIETMQNEDYFGGVRRIKEFNEKLIQQIRLILNASVDGVIIMRRLR